jgi:phosphatidylserine/phosphatidylglycerophosphate/cardiolipin synthase-like enzyme
MSWTSLVLYTATSFQSGAPAAAGPPLQLVESAPIETTLDHADVPDAADVWLAMIDGARSTLDFGEFYASGAPGSKLEPIVAAIERAARRGVVVRFLLERRFCATYPEIPARLATFPHTTVRTLDLKPLTGGVLHAKYFLVDAREAYFGSQNFDWRSLEHIQELGVRVRLPEVVAAFADWFAHDWRLAGSEPVPATGSGVASEPARIASGNAGAELTVVPVGSPRDMVRDAEWELPRIVALIDGARTSVRVQLLTYKANTYDAGYWSELEDALRRAAARGVVVQLLLADWCKRKGTIEGLQSLEPLANVEVKLVTIPQWSGGFVPYARVCHAKYMVVDGAQSWIGTSNWERDYFYASRNVGLVVVGAGFALQLERFFADGWSSKYASAIDPCAHYEAPRIDR